MLDATIIRVSSQILAMAITYISFIECVVDKRDRLEYKKWYTVSGFPEMNDQSTRAIYKAKQDEARVDLVDINGTRRYFSFRKDGEIHIINNVIAFDDDWVAEEAVIDESKQFPKKKRMDE